MDILRSEDSEPQANQSIRLNAESSEQANNPINAFVNIFQGVMENVIKSQIDRLDKEEKENPGKNEFLKLALDAFGDKSRIDDEEYEDEEEEEGEGDVKVTSNSLNSREVKATTSDSLNNIQFTFNDSSSMQQLNIISYVYGMMENLLYFLKDSPLAMKFDLFPVLLGILFTTGNIYLIIPAISIFFFDNMKELNKDRNGMTASVKDFWEKQVRGFISFLPFLYLGGNFLAIFTLSTLLLKKMREGTFYTDKINYFSLFTLCYQYYQYKSIDYI